jgi:hypothetical protein
MVQAIFGETMTRLEIILLVVATFEAIAGWIYRHFWKDEEAERIFWNRKHDHLVRTLHETKQELEATKAELDTYKHHQSETAKVFAPLGKKVTVSTEGAGMGSKAAFEVFGLDTELVNDPHNVRYTFCYKGNRYLGYEVVDGKILAYPLSEPVITEAGKNVETFLEF